ncbi:hypothetical protein [Ruficoccus sp. ZRK36]|jgi:hypothetical protein|uniref:hypothetical protein n=1 Tax=Ruficoccus sp. ZRK36 TaxID=2866311 RepID=UPI001C731850|nr:hypothetical protein [Ruficoccus sp. ZRK36]QYY34612.1 hypothetical protein K0V07_09885 [Ruficoccus sp. ZRK36]
MPNPNLLLIGSGDFSIITGITAAPANEAEYDDANAMFGNLKAFSFQNQAETKEHFGSYRSVKILDRVFTTQLRLGYLLQLEEVDDRAVESLFYGASGELTGSNPDYREINPFQRPQSLTGFARLRVWDDKNSQSPRLMHKDFWCNVRLNNQPEVGDEWFGYEMKVDVLSPVGTVFLRQDA